jgi:hypothetical protein
MSKLIKYNSVRLPLASIANSFVQLVVRKELSTNRNELAAFKGNFNRKNNRNQLRKSQDRQDSYEKKFIFRGKSNQYIEKIDDEESLDEKPELEEDLELFSRNENTYHKKVIDEDIKQRKRIKYGIIKKKMSTLEGYTHSYFNLLSWDAKEQIKYLNLNEPGNFREKQTIFIFFTFIYNLNKIIGLWKKSAKVFQLPKKIVESYCDQSGLLKHWMTCRDMMKK